MGYLSGYLSKGPGQTHVICPLKYVNQQATANETSEFAYLRLLGAYHHHNYNNVLLQVETDKSCRRGKYVSAKSRSPRRERKLINIFSYHLDCINPAILH